MAEFEYWRQFAKRMEVTRELLWGLLGGCRITNTWPQFKVLKTRRCEMEHVRNKEYFHVISKHFTKLRIYRQCIAIFPYYILRVFLYNWTKSGNDIYTLILMKGMKSFLVSYIIMSPDQISVSTAMITKTKDQVWRVHLRCINFFCAK